MPERVREAKSAEKKEEHPLVLSRAGTVEMVLDHTKNMLDISDAILANAPGKYTISSSLIKQYRNKHETPPYGKEFRDKITGMEFVWVAGGIFDMGDVLGDYHSRDEDLSGILNALPVHKVELPGFYLGRYVVTQGEWVAIMQQNPSYFQYGERYPVEMVSWHDCQTFIKKLNQQSGRHYSLPSEAQWEYAAREGGKRVRFGTGKDVIGTDEANFNGDSDWKESYAYTGDWRMETVPVDSFSANSLGLYQMSGNVWEWCQDRWHDNYEGAPADGSAWESGDSSARVVRGGCWDGGPWYVRAADRGRNSSVVVYDYLGFRLALPIW